MHLYARLLGKPHIECSGRPLTLTSLRGAALLWRLAADPGRPQPRGVLGELFWPDAPPDRRLNNLSVTLSRLRRELPVWPLGGDRQALWWDASGPAGVDLLDFLAEVGTLADEPTVRRHRLRRALSLWRGPLLDGLALPGSPAYEDWLLEARATWNRRALDALAELCRLEQLAGDWEGLRQAADLALAIDPLDERSLRWLMRAHLELGERAPALERFHVLSRRLREDLGAEPEAATLALYRTIAGGARKPSWFEQPDDRPTSDTLPTGRGAQPTDPPIGREREWLALERWLDPAAVVTTAAGGEAESPPWEGGPAAGLGGARVALIEGEMGIGKTHLVEAVLHRLGHRGPDSPGRPPSVEVLLARCYEEADDVAYHPIAAALSPVVARLDPASPPLPEPHMEALTRLFPDLAKTHGTRGSPWPRPSDRAGNRSPFLYEALCRLLELLPAPILLIVEDVHWADEESVRCLAFIARRSGLGNLRVLLTARTDEPDHLAAEVFSRLEREGRLARLRLGPLDLRASSRLVAMALGKPAPSLSRRLHALTRGNPLYLTEVLKVIRMRRSEGAPAAGVATAEGSHPAPLLILPDRGEADLIGPVDDLRLLPPTMEAAIRERLVRLPVAAATLAEAAAVFPEPQPLTVVARAAGLSGDQALAALDLLIEARILVEDDARPPRLVFHHPLFRHTLRAGCNRSRWIELNRQAFFSLLAARHPRAADDTAPTGELESLARMATEGCLWEEGLRWSLAAAGRAERACAVGATIRLLKQALSNLDRLPRTAERQEFGADLRLRLWEASLMGAPDEADHLMAELSHGMTTEGGNEERHTEWLHLRASTFLLRGRLPLAVSLLRGLLATARRVGHRPLQALAHMRLGQVYAIQGRFPAARLELETCLALLDMPETADLQYGVRSALAAVIGSTGRFEEAEARLERILANEGKQSIPGLYALLQVGTMAHMRGDWPSAVRACRRVLALARRRGERSFVYLAQLFAALPLGYLADLRLGLRVQEEAIGLGERMGVGLLADRALAWLAELHFALGEIPAAAAAAERGLDLARRNDAPFAIALNERWLGRAHAAEGRLETGVALLESSLDTLLRLRALPEVARSDAALATVLAAAGELAKARRHHRRAALLFKRLGMRWDLERLGTPTPSSPATGAGQTPLTGHEEFPDAASGRLG